MKKSELVKLIESMVRKEVKKQVDTIFINEGIRSIKEAICLVQQRTVYFYSPSINGRYK